jgi:signal transduction histidine kinase/ActR/RegA family two-component response regulator
MGLEAPIEKLAAGPVHFSHTGWALVDIKAESRPSSDDSFYFLYDHPYSFEADAWLEAGRETSIPVCIMNSGYSSGWCEESYGIPLVTYEVLCRARGDEACRFIMGHPERIESHVDRFVQSHGVGAKRRRDVPIPDFFYRKRAEEELRRGRADLEARVAERTRELSETNTRLREEMRQRERAEKKLLSSAKLEALGKLAGGIAHDFNNLMSVVIGHASMLEQKLDDDSFLAQVAQIRLAGEQAAALTQQLLAFSAARVAQQEPLAFDHTVAEVARLIGRLLGDDITLDLELGDPRARVLIDRSQLTQVIMNLALNARDAMKDGGVVKIVTASVEVTKETPLESHDVPMGHFSVVEVSDTGVGMDDETLARAFEPFFTTKTAEGGTGLGLPTVSSVVTRSKGHISISTAPSEGTRIRIYLPRLETAEPIAPEARPLTPIPRGQETILVVEDQAGVRQMVVQLLETLGYTVIAAASPTEALRLAEERDSGLSLLLTDVVMPSMSGRELADRLQRKFGALPVLFVSGYADDEVLRYGVAQGTADLLPKPFTPNELAERVRAALDRARR